MIEIALWIVGGIVSAAATFVVAVGAVEHRQRKQVEALGRRRKDQIQL